MQKSLRTGTIIISITIIALAAFLYMKTGKVQAEGELVGFVDSDMIVEQYAPAREANMAWDNYRGQHEAELRAKLMAKYKTEDLAALPAQDQLEIQKTIEDAEAQMRVKFEEIRKNKWEPAREKIQETIKAVAAEKGVRVVLEKKVVLTGGIDITEAVLEELNQ